MSKTASAAEVADLRLGVLIDAENISHNVIGTVLTEIPKHGNTVFKRVYGDFSHQLLSGWKTQAQLHALQPVHNFRNVSGKSNSDMSLTIDAMDWLHSGKIDCICIVTSDSDFSLLALRMKEAGLIVYGFGESKTPQALVKACHRFFYIEALKVLDNPKHNQKSLSSLPQVISESDHGKEVEPTLENITLPWEDLVFEIKRAIMDKSDANGMAALSTVGHMLGKRFPDFSAQNYGFTKLAYLMESAGFTIHKKGDEPTKSNIYVSLAENQVKGEK